MFLQALATFSLASISYAQITHNISVGADGTLTFSPNQITAAVGDTVQLLFLAKNHTATQSSFDSPCSRLIGADGVTPTGFDSGFQPVPPGGDIRTASFKVETTDPLWFYCRQTGHCPQGMVFAVNAPTYGDKTFDKFLANALASGNNTVTTTASPPPSTTTGSMVTVTTSPPAVSVITVTQTVTLGGNTWTTTYGSYPGSPNPTPNETPVVHTVKVGENGGLTFNPPNITAQPRDVVLFQFLARNHTATQSSFDNPCRRLGDTTPNKGFDSGFKPVTQGDLVPQLFNITVSDTAPIWVYCRQTNPSSHCGAGMVFSVNANEGGLQSFTNFKANAIRLNGTVSNNNTSTTTATPQPGAASLSSMPSITFAGIGMVVSALWILTL